MYARRRCTKITKDDKFLELAPIAVSMLSKKSGMVGSFVTKDDLINEAYAYGYWRNYTGWSRGNLLTIIGFDMIRGLKKLQGQSVGVEDESKRVDPSSESDVDKDLTTNDFLDFVMESGGLSAGERDVMEKIFVGGLTAVEVGVTRGSSRQSVNMLRVRGLSKVKNLLLEREPNEYQ